MGVREFVECCESILIGDIVAEVAHRRRFAGAGEQSDAVALRRLFDGEFGDVVAFDDADVGKLLDHFGGVAVQGRGRLGGDSTSMDRPRIGFALDEEVRGAVGMA